MSSTRSRIVRVRALALALVVTALPACGYGSPGHVEVGSGDVVSRARTVGDFTEVQAGGGIQVELASGPKQVAVTAQPNIVDITRTDVTGARLTLDTSSGFMSPDGIIVKVTVPRLTVVELSGGASASGTVGKADALAVRMSGGARATLSGSAGTLDVQASGGAIPAFGDLRTTDAKVDLSGGVVATVAASGSVTGTASGGVVLTLVRKPVSSTVETSGGAVVNFP